MKKPMINIIFHSMHAHVFKLAEAVVKGAKSVKGVEVGFFQVIETLPDEVIGKIDFRR